MCSCGGDRWSNMHRSQRRLHIVTASEGISSRRQGTATVDVSVGILEPNQSLVLHGRYAGINASAHNGRALVAWLPRIARKSTPNCGRRISLPYSEDTAERRKTMYSSTTTDFSLGPTKTLSAAGEHLLTIHSSERYIGVGSGHSPADFGVQAMKFGFGRKRTFKITF